MKRYLVAISLLPCVIEAQSNQVLAIGGQLIDNGFTISGTFGQAFTNQVDTSIYHLSEGFQQIHILKQKKQDLKDFAVYPNPTNQILNIKSNHLIEDVSILSMEGRMMHYIQHSSSANMQIDLIDLPPAMYMIHVTYSDHKVNHTSKIIKL